MSSRCSQSLSLELTRLNFATQTLYGREVEVEQLRTAYKNASETQDPYVVFIGGVSGTGKTALVDSLRDHTGDNAYFIMGKFDQYVSHRPLAPLIDALDELYRLLPTNDEALQLALRDGMRNEKLVLLDLVPQYATLWGENVKTPPVYSSENFRAAANFNQLKSVFKTLLNIISDFKPLVLFVDDLQWTDGAFLSVLQFLLQNAKRFLFIGCYRDNEVPRDHILAIKMRELGVDNQMEHSFTQCETNARLTNITLENLPVGALNCFIAEVLKSDLIKTRDLSAIVHWKTLGNIFFVIQFMDMLRQSGLLHFNCMVDQWDWDVDAIQSNTNLAANVVEVVANKIMRLGPETIEALKIAACLGSRFDGEVVGMILDEWKRHSSIEESWDTRIDRFNMQDVLRSAIDECLIDEVRCTPGLHMESTIMKWSHDRIQQAAYSLIPEGRENKMFHLRIGKMLKSVHMSTMGKDWMLLVSVDQLNRCIEYLTGEEEKIELAMLNLSAAEKVRSKSAFFAAEKYLEAAMDLLGDEKWERHYGLSLDVCCLACEMEYVVGNFDKCKKLVGEILIFAKCIDDKLRAYVMLAEVLGTQKRYKEVLEIGCSILCQLDETIPSIVSKRRLVMEFLRVERNLKGKSEEQLLLYKELSDVRKESAIRMLTIMVSFSWLDDNALTSGFIVCRLMHLSIRHGFSKYTPAALTMYGGVLARLGRFKLASKCGDMALKLSDRFQSKECDARTLVCQHSFIHHLFHPVHHSLGQLLYAHRVGMATGDIDFGEIASATYAVKYYWAGLPLNALERDSKSFIKEMEDYKQSKALYLCRCTRQLALNLMGRSPDPCKLEGEEIADLATLVREGGEIQNVTILRFVTFCEMQLAYYFGDLTLAKQLATKHAQYKDIEYPIYYSFHMPFFRGMIWLALVQHGKKAYRRRAVVEIKRMRMWRKAGLINVHHMLLILEAELASVTQRNRLVVKDLYDKAISAAGRSGFTNNEALANHRAGVYFVGHDEEHAQFYLTRASALYQEWCAYGIVHLLHANHHINTVASCNLSTHGSNHQGLPKYSERESTRHKEHDWIGSEERCSSLRMNLEPGASAEIQGRIRMRLGV